MQSVTGWSGSTPKTRQDWWKNNREEWRSVGHLLLALDQLPAWLKEVIPLLPYPHKRWTLPKARNAGSSSPHHHMRNKQRSDRTKLASHIVSHEPLQRNSSKLISSPARQIAVALASRCQAHQRRSLATPRRPRPSRGTHSRMRLSDGRHYQLIGRA